MMNEYPILMQWQQGGGPSPQAQAIQSAPVPTPAPPVTSTSAEVIQAQQDFTQNNLAKKSVKKTILAGDTGGMGLGKQGLGLPQAPGSDVVTPPRRF